MGATGAAAMQQIHNKAHECAASIWVWEAAPSVRYDQLAARVRKTYRI
jgi:hypothetical protein